MATSPYCSNTRSTSRRSERFRGVGWSFICTVRDARSRLFPLMDWMLLRGFDMIFVNWNKLHLSNALEIEVK
jgi:hypothetical protein